jgi:hypothetical protein
MDLAYTPRQKAFREEVGEMHKLSEKELYNWR